MFESVKSMTRLMPAVHRPMIRMMGTPSTNSTMMASVTRVTSNPSMIVALPQSPSMEWTIWNGSLRLNCW